MSLATGLLLALVMVMVFGAGYALCLVSSSSTSKMALSMRDQAIKELERTKQAADYLDELRKALGSLASLETKAELLAQRADMLDQNVGKLATALAKGGHLRTLEESEQVGSSQNMGSWGAGRPTALGSRT